jgi:hypothetical protein
VSVATPGTDAASASSPLTSLLDRAQAVALRLDLGRVALANGAVIVLLGVLGVLYLAFESPFGFFELDGERNAPATYSAALWTLVALVAVLLGRVDRAPGARLMWLGLSAPLLLVAADEFGEIHERLERITGIDWQILYSPLALVAVFLWVLVGRRLRTLAGFGLFVAGTVCGAASQILEAVEYGPNDKEIRGFDELVVAEELLETVAVLLVGLALLAALRAVSSRARA